VIKVLELFFDSSFCKVLDKNDSCVFIGNRDNNVYTIDMNNVISNISCLSAINEDSWLWHKRLGHASFDHLSRIGSKGVVKGIPNVKFIKDMICDACQFGKQIKSSFKTLKDVVTTRPLELIHMDLFGPTKTKSLSDNCYAYVLVDDFSRFTWTFFLKHKDEAISHFNAFCKRVQREKDLSIVRIRSDRGGEFMNHHFITFVKNMALDMSYLA